MNYDEMVLRDKIAVLQEHTNSQDILDSLLDYTNDWECNDSSFEVHDNPFAYNVERLREVLSDLAQHTELSRCDSDIPEHLKYINEFLEVA